MSGLRPDLELGSGTIRGAAEERQICIIASVRNKTIDLPALSEQISLFWLGRIFPLNDLVTPLWP